MIAGVGFALFIIPGVGGSYWRTFFPAVMVLGLGMAISVAPLTTTVMNAVTEKRAGIASGINNAVSRAAGLLAIAALGIVMLHAFNRSLDRRLSVIGPSVEVVRSLDSQRTSMAAAKLPNELEPATSNLLREAINESFVAAFRRVMLIGALLAFASALSAWVFIDGKQRVSLCLKSIQRSQRFSSDSVKSIRAISGATAINGRLRTRPERLCRAREWVDGHRCRQAGRKEATP